MWRVLRALIWLQFLAITGAVVAAGVDVESIYVAGACVAPIGMAIARVAFRSGRLWGLVFGLAAPSVAVVVGTLIMYQSWWPHEAEGPVFVLLLCMLPVLLVLAGLALPERDVVLPKVNRGRYQFTAGTLLAVTLGIAAPLASYRTFGGGHRGQTIAILAAHLLLVGFVFWRFFRRCRVQRNEPSTA